MEQRPFGSLSALMLEIDDWCGTGWPRKFPPPKKSEIKDVFISLAIHNLADQISDVKAREKIQSLAAELYVIGGKGIALPQDPIPIKSK